MMLPQLASLSETMSCTYELNSGFYHVGGSEKNRNPVVEALVTNYLPEMLDVAESQFEQLTLFEPRPEYKLA